MSSRNPSDEPISSYADKYMRHFVRQSIKVGKVGAFNQSYESQISNKVFETIGDELEANGNKMKLLKFTLNLFFLTEKNLKLNFYRII